MNAVDNLPTVDRDQFMAFFRHESFHELISDDDAVEIFRTVMKGASDFTKNLLDEIFIDYQVDFLEIVEISKS